MGSKGVIMEDNRLFRWLGTALLIIMALTALYVLVGCRTKYVTVPEYHTVYTHNTDTFLRSDTLFRLDSVVVRMQGDTTVIEKIRWQNRFVNVYKIKTDTIIKADSVRVPYPVEKNLSKWQQFRLDFGGWAMGVLALGIVFLFIRLLGKFLVS